MHILLLGSSNDAGNWFEGGKKQHEIVAERLEQDYGEQIEVTVKSIWPRSDLPQVVAGWMTKYEPDAVYLNTGSYWFLYRSVPLRMQRLFGRFGPAAGKAGFRLADSKRWAHNAVFRALRVALQRTVGGDTHFTPEEVIERISDTLRVVVRHEGIAIVVKGPHGKRLYPGTKRRQRQDEVERLRVHAAFETLCEQLHVTYDGSVEMVRHRPAYKRGTSVGDGLHGNALRHELESDVMYEGIRRALVASNYQPRAAASHAR